MTSFHSRADVERVARLARLELSEEELARLAPTLEAITRDFARLADDAARLPEPDDGAPGALRTDEVARESGATLDLILKNARADPSTRLVRARHE